MGCCQSTPNEDIAPAAHHQEAPPARPLQPAQQPTPHSISSTHSPRQSQDAPQLKAAGGSRLNKAIRAPSPLRSSPSHLPHRPPPWTRTQLEDERAAFFDTRVTGRAEVWDALQLACSLLRQGNLVEAQGIVDAVGLTCPYGRVAVGKGRDRAKGGIYDERGELYELPPWVVADPRDLVNTRQSDGGAEPLEDPPGDEKGKGRAADTGDMIQIRARLSDRGTDVLVSIGSKEIVAVAIHKIQRKVGAKRMRLVYLGRVLDETKTLDAQGYRLGDVLNAYVFDGPEDLLRKQRSK